MLGLCLSVGIISSSAILTPGTLTGMHPRYQRRSVSVYERMETDFNNDLKNFVFDSEDESSEDRSQPGNSFLIKVKAWRFV